MYTHIVLPLVYIEGQQLPRKHIYVRVEDKEKWEAIEDIPKWLHEALQRDPKLKRYVEAVDLEGPHYTLSRDRAFNPEAGS